jgi:hypothetical protein
MRTDRSAYGNPPYRFRHAGQLRKTSFATPPLVKQPTPLINYFLLIKRLSSIGHNNGCKTQVYTVAPAARFLFPCVACYTGGCIFGEFYCIITMALVAPAAFIEDIATANRRGRDFCAWLEMNPAAEAPLSRRGSAVQKLIGHRGQGKDFKDWSGRCLRTRRARGCARH